MAEHDAPQWPEARAESRLDLGTALCAALAAACLAAAVVLLPPSALLAFVLGFGLALLAVVVLVRRRLHEAHCDAAVVEEEAAGFVAHTAELEERVRELEAVVEDLSRPVPPGDFVLCRDADGCLSYVGDGFAAAVGRRPEDLLGRRIAAPLEDEAPDLPRRFDQRLETVTGPRWIAWDEQPVVDADGRLVGVRSVGRDITERKAAEEALAEARAEAKAANEAQSRFLAAVSHELRTPLNGVLGMAGLLLDTPLSPEQKTYAAAIAGSGEALLGIIDDILDFSKIEAGKVVLEPAPFAPAALAVDIAELLAPRAQAKGLDLQAYVSPKVPDRIIGDAMRLRQVLLNLVGNAIKFTERGGIALLVACRGVSDGRARLSFTVRDTGIGIAEEDQTRIFGEFEQAEAGRARSRGGTGLGLAIASRIVELMDGRISLTSAPGQGSAFSFDLTLAIAEDSAPGAAEAPAAPLVGRRVLAATPSVVLAPVLARMLADAGAAAERAARLDQAAHRLAAAEFDAVVVDLAFGLDAVERFARERAESTRLIVLVTPAERTHLERLGAAGFATYLVKPVRARSLCSRIADIDSPAEAEAEDEALPEVPPLSVLVAEDNDVNALLTMKLLESLGHAPQRAADGHEAVEAVRAAAEAGAPFDLILLDLNMPGLDGFAAAAAIRALPPAAGVSPGAVPILALTANAFVEDRAESRAAGLDDHLVKPLSRRALAQALARWAPDNPEPRRVRA